MGLIRQRHYSFQKGRMTENIYEQRKAATRELKDAMEALDQHRGRIVSRDAKLMCTTYESAFTLPYSVMAGDTISLPGRRLENGLGVLRRLSDTHPPQIAQVRDAITDISAVWTRDKLHGIAEQYRERDMKAVADRFMDAMQAYMALPVPKVGFVAPVMSGKEVGR